MIREMTQTDAAWAADRHAELMADSVFALFGREFLRGLYTTIAASRRGVAFVLEENGTPAGAIASTTDRPGLLLEWAARKRLTPVFTAAARFLTDRRCRRLILQSPRYLLRASKKGCRAEMIFITVAPAARRRGAARELIEKTLDAMRQKGVTRACVSIESANAPISALLTDMGFKKVDSFVFAGKSNDLLVRELDTAR